MIARSKTRRFCASFRHLWAEGGAGFVVSKVRSDVLHELLLIVMVPMTGVGGSP
jgi:hypothetical protein